MERTWITVEGNEAVATIAYALSEVAAIYPITPSTPMGEQADAWSAAGRPNLWGTVPLVVEMQSEGGAAGAIHGALQIGAFVEYIEMISELDGYYVINGKSYPDTQPIKLKHGQTVRLRIIGASQMIHPMHLHGGFFNIVAEDGHTLQVPIQKDTLPVAPGETYDLTFYGWAAPGSVYPFQFKRGAPELMATYTSIRAGTITRAVKHPNPAHPPNW